MDLSAHPLTASLLVANDERQLRCTHALLGRANKLRQMLIGLKLVHSQIAMESTAASSATAATLFLVHQARGERKATALPT